MQKKIISILLVAMFFSHFLFAEKVAHFSVDDVQLCFADLAKNEHKYNSVFNISFFNYLKKLNEKFGVKVTLYCACESEYYSLAQGSSKFADEFKANSDWLKFGYHTTDYHTNEGGGYTMFVNEMSRITGGSECLSSTVRLEKFSGSEEEIVKMKNSDCGITALLCADSKERKSYYLDGSAQDSLWKSEKYFDGENGLRFYETDFRFDEPKNAKKLLLENLGEDELICFTHEWILNVPARKNLVLWVWNYYRSLKVKKEIEYALGKILGSGYRFVFDLEG